MGLHSHCAGDIPVIFVVSRIPIDLWDLDCDSSVKGSVISVRASDRCFSDLCDLACDNHRL